MIVRKEIFNSEVRERMRDGAGSVEILSPMKKEQYPPHVRLYSTMVLKKGCGIGMHTHTNECEIYCILQGEANYNDNGREYILRKGDVSVTYNGQAHAISNENDEDLLVLATIVTE